MPEFCFWSKQWPIQFTVWIGGLAYFPQWLRQEYPFIYTLMPNVIFSDNPKNYSVHKDLLVVGAIVKIRYCHCPIKTRVQNQTDWLASEKTEKTKIKFYFSEIKWYLIVNFCVFYIYNWYYYPPIKIKNTVKFIRNKKKDSVFFDKLII